MTRELFGSFSSDYVGLVAIFFKFFFGLRWIGFGSRTTRAASQTAQHAASNFLGLHLDLHGNYMDCPACYLNFLRAIFWILDIVRNKDFPYLELRILVEF